MKRPTTTTNHSIPLLSLLLAAIAALGLMATACSSGDPAAVDVQTNADSDSTEDTGEDPSGSADDDGADPSSSDDGDANTDDENGGDDNGDGDSADGDGTTGDSDGDEPPGEPWDGFADAGDLFGVVGVAHDDVLNVRAQPNADAEIIDTLGPTETGIEATGEGWMLPSSLWYSVKTEAGIGWVSARFVAFIGGTDDATAEYLALDGGTATETMVQLADEVADTFIFEHDVGTRIVQTVPPTVGDLGEITYDIIGLGDDAVGGFRLHIFASPADHGEGFDLKSIERTYLCSRGVDDGLCL